MIRLIRTELLKQRTSRLTVAALAAVPVIAVLVTVAVFSTAGEQGNEPLGAHSLTDALAAPASIITVMALLIGVLGMAGEYRHQTVTTTFLATPRRGEVVVAKLAAHALIGAVIALSALAVTTAVALPWLHDAGVGVTLDGDVLRVAGGVLVSTVLHAALGVSIGALVRNQTAAVTIVLVWILAVEGLVAGILGDWSVLPWLPAAAASALVHLDASRDLLAMWAGGAVLAGYVVAFGAGATRFVVSRDVT